MKVLVSALLSAATLSISLVAGAADTLQASARDLHAAQCVAALEVLTEDLAEQVKAGKEEVRPLLMDRLISGTAFVGDSYLHGLNDEKQARALADQALEAQKGLPAKELAARQEACADEGAKLYGKSSGLEKAVVTRFAKKRMNKLLGV